MAHAKTQLKNLSIGFLLSMGYFLMPIAMASNNLTPTNINLSEQLRTRSGQANLTLPKSMEVGTVISDLGATDPNKGDTHTYQLSPGCDIEQLDNDTFEIANNQLKLLQPLTKTEYTICIKTTDQGNLSFEKAFTFKVTENDPKLYIQTTGEGNGIVQTHYVGENTAGLSIMQLWAVADNDSVFTYWRDDNAPECHGTNSLTEVLIDNMKTCIAYFEPIGSVTDNTSSIPAETFEDFALNFQMKGQGNGMINSEQVGQDATEIPLVKLVAEADENSLFSHWDQDNAPECYGENPIIEQIAIDANKTCIAYFKPISIADKKEQIITIKAEKSPDSFFPKIYIVGDALTLSVTGGESGNPVELKENDTSVCKITGSTLTLLKPGLCGIRTTQAGTKFYLDADSKAVYLQVLSDKTTITGQIYSDNEQFVMVDDVGNINSITTIDTISVSLNIEPTLKDVGKKAEVLLVANVNGQWFQATKQGWQTWDQNENTLESLTQITLDKTVVNLPVYRGTLPLVGIVKVLAGYRLASGEMIKPQQILLLKITQPQNPEQVAQNDCEKQGGIYFIKRCFTDLHALKDTNDTNVDSFKGGIYQFDQPPEQALQQTIDIECRANKRVAILGRFNTPEEYVGTKAEIAMVFSNQSTGIVYSYDGQGFQEVPYEYGFSNTLLLDKISGKPTDALPAIYATTFFEGQLPTQGELDAHFGFIIRNEEGDAEWIQYSITPLKVNVLAESCMNPDLKLDITLQGDGKGKVESVENSDGTIQLTATAVDSSIFYGWEGDMKGCEGREARIVVTPQIHPAYPEESQYTCHPVFGLEVLGTLDCEEGDTTCCDANDINCPVIPSSCHPPKTSTRWIHYIPNTSSVFVGKIVFTNMSNEIKKLQWALNDQGGKDLGGSSIELEPFEIKSLSFSELEAESQRAWSGRASMKINGVDDDVRVAGYVKRKTNDNLWKTLTATSKHRLYNLPASDDQQTKSIIYAYNTGNEEISLLGRLIDNDSYQVFELDKDTSIQPNSFIRMTSSELFELIEFSYWSEGSWIEIFPEDVAKRCNGNIQLQLFVSDYNFINNLTLVDE